MTTQYDLAENVKGAVLLQTNSEVLLKDIMVALKQLRTEMNRVANALEVMIEKPEPKNGAD